jgi:hypothetical protein
VDKDWQRGNSELGLRVHGMQRCSELSVALLLLLLLQNVRAVMGI